MVLGFLRRKKDRSGQAGPASTPVSTASSGDLTRINGPLGERTEHGYIPDPRELAAAIPLPAYALGADEALQIVGGEEYGWVLLNTQTWKPCRPQGIKARKLASPVMVPGKPYYQYHVMVWFDGKVYLLDGFTYGLLYDSDCTRTAQEVVGGVLDDFFRSGPKDDPDRKAWESGEMTESIMDHIAGAYLQLALLKHYGLLT